MPNDITPKDLLLDASCHGTAEVTSMVRPRQDIIESRHGPSPARSGHPRWRPDWSAVQELTLGQTGDGTFAHMELESTVATGIALRMLNQGLSVYERHGAFCATPCFILGRRRCVCAIKAAIATYERRVNRR